jgi:ferredoxin-type protein NapF
MFFAAFRGRTGEIRPPWAISDPLFTDRCTACGDCVPSCPQHILAVGDGGFPKVDFTRGACDFCGACNRACPEGPRLFTEQERNPWSLTPRFAESCLSGRGIACRTCGDWCDSHAIRFRLEVGGRAHPELTISDCTGCGACVSACPVQAIQMESSE